MIALLRAAFFLAVLALAFPALAQSDFTRGVEAFKRGDHAEAAQHFRNGVEKGDPGSAINLGHLYDNGWGVPRDGRTAEALYIASAQSGNVMAKNNLAYLWARQNGLLEQALCLSAQTLEAEPDNAYYLDTYGFILLRLNQPAKAEAYFRKALRLLPGYPDVLEHLGDVASMTGRSDAADYWRQALAKPRDARQTARVQAKLGGAPGLGDLNEHPPFALHDPGVPRDCGMPSV